MHIAASNPRRARLVATLAGIALTILGGVLWLIGDDNESIGSQGMVNFSSATWGDVLGYDSGEDAEFEAARDQQETGETQMTMGIILMVAGLAVVGSRWLIRPTTEK
ncbi:hypothetical protein [Streptomyces chilikensis]|uniref:LPXTG cell wall anchor domain-containing protein n=1 Tax=Streptomyces chilikensis TaxID=1194079 RepID=A0ABV3ERG4_9ACTN